MSEITHGILGLFKINSLQELRRPDSPPNVHSGHLLLVMAVNCLTGLPMEADLRAAGYNLESAMQQVGCSVLINKSQRPAADGLGPQPK